MKVKFCYERDISCCNECPFCEHERGHENFTYCGLMVHDLSYDAIIEDCCENIHPKCPFNSQNIQELLALNSSQKKDYDSYRGYIFTSDIN